MNKQSNSAASIRPTLSMGNKKSSGGRLPGQDSPSANVPAANLKPNQAKTKTNKNGAKEESLMSTSTGKSSTSKINPGSSASTKRPSSKISSGKGPSEPYGDPSVPNTTAQGEASIQTRKSDQSAKTPLYKSSSSVPQAQVKMVDTEIKDKDLWLEELRSIRNMLSEIKKDNEAGRDVLSANTSSVKDVHLLMQQYFSVVATKESEDQLGPEKSKLTRLENDEKQQINILTRERNELKKENEELQAAQISTQWQSRQYIQRLSVDEDGSLATEVRALREQLALDSDAIRNLENLLQLAREGSNGGTGSSAASTALKELELERTGLIGRREEANRKELDALRVRNHELVTELEQLRKAQDNNQFNLSGGGGSYPMSEVTEGLPRRSAAHGMPENAGSSFVSEVRRVTPQERDEWVASGGPPARSNFVPEGNSFGGNQSNQELRLVEE